MAYPIKCRGGPPVLVDGGHACPGEASAGPAQFYPRVKAGFGNPFMILAVPVDAGKCWLAAMSVAAHVFSSKFAPAHIDAPALPMARWIELSS